MRRIGVIGGGAWGTALAALARAKGREVVLWAREPEVVAAINAEHRNPQYLPEAELDPAIRATEEMAEAARADALLLVAPAQYVRAVCAALEPDLSPAVPLVICAKGIERDSGKLLSEVVAETCPEAPLAVLSGPTFAGEAVRGLPTAVTLACADGTLARRLAEALGSPTFRPYLSDDVVGAQIGGAVKNVIAIACGIAEGRGRGESARAALIARGMAEILRLGSAKGATERTLMGLSGLGDLVLTCTSPRSRNTSLGIALGQGQNLDEVLGQRRSVAEGVATADAVSRLAGRLEIEMPICTAVDGIVNHDASIDATIRGLIEGPFKSESK